MTLTEENYIKAIYHLETDLDDAVSTKSISESLHVNAASVTDMFKKLADQKVVLYEKSRGVKLTDRGRKIALMIIRKHRLWETFLVNKLQFSWDEVHDVAEELEHIHSDLLIERLDKLLNFPKFDPHGDPIPDAHGNMPVAKTILLTEAKVGTAYKLCGVNDDSPAFLKYLSKVGITLGDSVKVTEREEYDHSVNVILSNKRTVTLSKNAAENLLLKS